MRRDRTAPDPSISPLRDLLAFFHRLYTGGFFQLEPVNLVDGIKLGEVPEPWSAR